jgi:hypothetical protein
VSTHCPWQHDCAHIICVPVAAWHGAPLPHEHAPSEQVSPMLHTCPTWPQLCGSFATSMQPALEHVVPSGHGTATGKLVHKHLSKAHVCPLSTQPCPSAPHVQ